MWLCRCDCGNETTVATSNLTKKQPTKSCGCHRREEIGNRSRTHGDGSIPRGIAREYAAWQQMKNRCLNPNDKRFADYGGRGITVCDRWVNTYENFLADMGRRPSSRHSLDRVDVNGNYEPSNCRWATNREQSRNRRDNHRLTLNGKTQSLIEWQEETGIHWATIKARLDTGWSVERALTEPVNTKKRNRYAKYVPSSATPLSDRQ
jgi:hypothetical protein